MTLDQLKILEATVSEGSLGGAAKALYRTQPTLSVAIKNLEEELGVSLFDRSSYRMELTDAGRELLKQSKVVLAEADKLISQASEFKQGREARLGIGIDYLCPMPILLKLLKEFSHSCGNTQLDLKFGVLSETESMVDQEETSIGLTPFVRNPQGYEMKQIAELQVVPLIASSLCPKGKVIEKTFLETPQIIAKTQDRTELGPFSGSGESNQWRVSDHMIKKELILNGFGWGHLEESSVASEIKDKDLIEVKNKYARRRTVPLFMVRKRSASKGPVASELWAYLIENFTFIFSTKG